MQDSFEITLTAEEAHDGCPEERATCGVFALRMGETNLSEGFDFYLKASRPGPVVSGYYAAEWLAWNWWRHLYEPYSGVADWGLVHQMASIGEGYLWPPIEIVSDGRRMTLVSEPSAEPDAKPFRYFGSARPAVMPLSVWRDALETWISQVIGRLRDAHLSETNLDRLWGDVQAERSDPDVAVRRRLEAMLGRDPASEEDADVERLIADADRLGADVLGEVAAGHARASNHEVSPLTAADFEKVARTSGYDASPGDGAKLGGDEIRVGSDDWPAWRLGVETAKALRRQEGLGSGPIDDGRLADMAGTTADALTGDIVGNAGLSFVLDDEAATSARLVMRPRSLTGRRFALARLIGDRLAGSMDGSPGALHPATRAHTYRQAAQRAFATELLGPFDAVDEMLKGDYDDEEARNDIAEHFRVSPWNIERQLRNHGRWDGELSERDLDPTFPG